jgi:hypothetical protein
MVHGPIGLRVPVPAVGNASREHFKRSNSGMLGLNLADVPALGCPLFSHLSTRTPRAFAPSHRPARACRIDFTLARHLAGLRCGEGSHG